VILRMAPRGALGAILWSAAAGLNAAAPPPAFYTAVEVDRFVPVRGVEFPFDYRTALMEDIARETSHALITVIILHEGETPPDGRAVLRVSGLIENFKPGSRPKRALIGFGAGATIIKALVRFTDAATGQVLLEREIEGGTWSGITGGDSQAADNSLAKQVVKLAKKARLIDSK